MAAFFSLILALIRNFPSLMLNFILELIPIPREDNLRRIVVMTTTLTPRKQSLRTYKDLPDMSTEGDLGQIVTVSVGYESRAFQIHLGKLGPLAKLVQGPSDKSSAFISLPNENPETFNAVVNWLYNGPLPRAAKTTEYIDNTKSLMPVPQSVKELPYLTWISDLPIRSQPETPAPRDDQLEDAHATQCMLLDIMMLAERHGWEELYNAAIDAFREGEANLERDRPSPQHIEVVYQRTSAGSPIRQFLGDYAYSLARANKDITWYWHENWFRKIPEFLEDMLKRVDGKGPFQYPFARGVGSSGEDGDSSGLIAHESPLELSGTTYHIHGGRMELDCKRSDDGSCAVE
ncbi:hypothetical protein F5Y12DRAFT_710546 [Xylaria sp. FL1777]|nr:hypothetical protein F5Y12DRAFT_710546 [Xylaria sp. FL1777]